MRRLTVQLCLVARLVWLEVAGATPTFPWTSFRAMAEEHPMRGLSRCDPREGRTEITDIVLLRPPGFYRLWVMLNGPDWAAIRYDEEARPDWVWRGTWSGDALSVASVSAYDPIAHASACELLFGTHP